MGLRGIVASVCVLVLGLGCGARTELLPTVDGRVETPPAFTPERCNGLDDDGDGQVDEPYRDAAGHYLDDDHCGGCGRPCGQSDNRVIEAHCRLLDGNPTCAATRCVSGWSPTQSGHCARSYQHLCLPCINDDDCGDVAGARCLTLAGDARCAEPCTSSSCPDGYACDADSSLCTPTSGSCSCEAGRDFDLACAVPGPAGALCAGSARCAGGLLTACTPPSESCNEADDDCDGVVDEGFRDARGAYSLDIHNCGACGVDCGATVLTQGALVCGGDAYAPSCVLDCPDTRDGVQPGDRIDGDRDIATGCECTVRSLVDDAGPVAANGAALDVNCDGADGVVVDSYYVATDGDDGGPGSPTRPLRTIAESMRRAAANRGMGSARIHVFVATGSYAEVVNLPDGVRVHGGYRRDFLALDPTGFLTEVRAPSAAASPGGAALVADGVGVAPTEVTWIRFVGLDASGFGGPSVGIYLHDAMSGLVLDGIEARGGVPGMGTSGVRGLAGASPTTAAVPGAPPRTAVEDSLHRCIASTENLVAGGVGSRNVCNGVDVSGGDGGGARCPRFGALAPDGAAGRGGTAPGAGGHGGQDSSAPVTGAACPDAPVCCGLADFNVPSDFVTPGPGVNGQSGGVGAVGLGCQDAYGVFRGGTWIAAGATAGSAGRAGSGGGGGGAGGGAEFAWTAGLCAYADGLGGGGGGGGAGGCGGAPGAAASSGGPSVAALFAYDTQPTALPTIRNCVFRTDDGGRGGDGGAGGEGGVGGIGALGTEIPRAQRITPSLAGPFAGGRGGRGGDGGPGGGGGGGCGGSSVGVWVGGLVGNPSGAVAAIRANNQFVLGRGGAAGRGGGANGSAGLPGGANDVLVR